MPNSDTLIEKFDKIISRMRTKTGKKLIKSLEKANKISSKFINKFLTS